jgi:predicted ATP-grasp superfamily ATP-dependent carboligase
MIFPKNRFTPVLVLNCSRQGGLGIVRSLGRLGIPVWGADANRFAAPLLSRYTRRAASWSPEHHNDEDAIAWLRTVAEKIGQKPILIPTTDAGALFVSRNAECLQNHFIFHRLPISLVDSLCSKKEMYFLAKRHSIPTPECVFPQCRKDVIEYAESGRFPVMLKGIDGKRLERVVGKRMFVIHTKSQLLRLYDTCEDPANPNIMLQEYIPGGDDTVWMFNGYFTEKSQCLFGITGKKIHQYPIHAGLTSLGVCLENQEVLNLTKKFMQAVGYRGILDIGFRYDACDGTYKVLDVNPRIGATFRLFTGKLGVDVARAMYFDLTGQKVPSDVARPGRKWVVEDMDFVSGVRYLFGRKIGLIDLIKSYSKVEEAAFFAVDDPLPFFLMFVNMFQKVLAK